MYMNLKKGDAASYDVVLRIVFVFIKRLCRPISSNTVVMLQKQIIRQRQS